MEAKNIDDVLVKSMMDPQNNQPEHVSTQVERPVESVQEAVDSPVDIEANAPTKQQEVAEEKSEVKEEKPAKEVKSDEPIDEYGNPIEKPKMYSEDEVQRMIRDRLSRGRHQDQQPTHQQIQKEAEGFKADPNSEESWEVQLEKFIDNRIDKRERNLSEKKWQQQEAAKQADFEAKFTSGMSKYQDFHSVVAGKPITDSMMLATRALDNPAAFIYGASKLHPQELSRISQIQDPYAQASEIGRLHERMIKERKVASNAPRPLEQPKSDLPAKHMPNQPSLEERIHQYAKQKRK